MHVLLIILSICSLLLLTRLFVSLEKANQTEQMLLSGLPISLLLFLIPDMVWIASGRSPVMDSVYIVGISFVLTILLFYIFASFLKSLQLKIGENYTYCS
ncbi:hypothetical protein BA724_06120 [Domibacillus iocasae]|uniref:Uncharacterized protein n=1 Tax=Domibacillus iocasae TaxID=1714016 RepID=A0A1E7DPB0_9BACI|nr:hypothetical protein BA724_06120 [Domibacillus iocasae]